MKLTRIGIDLAKQVFQVHGVDRHEQPVWRRRLSRGEFLQAVLEVAGPGCEIGMESCGGANHWGRQLQAHGLRVKLIAPQFVKPYVKSNKNDANDAEAICEAMSRPSMRFVKVKSVAQQDLQALHRVRAGLVQQRTAKGNQIRGLVTEYGLVAARELRSLRRAIPCWLEDADNGLSMSFRQLLDGLRRDLQGLDERIQELDGQILAAAKADSAAQRLQQLRGIGPLTATALVACVGDATQFANGREMAASLGLTPRQHSSGGKEHLLGISKRGDAYVRWLLVHGARAALQAAPRHDDPLSRWATRLAARAHPNVACVALANKTARMAWALLRRGTDYQPELAAAA